MRCIAMRRATAQSIQGPALTPFLLDTLHRLSGGATLRANQALLVANARLTAQLARACRDATLPG
ncbi:MAG: pseudouridine-5'-phosphate glycosidase [Terriglobia bacterium]